MFNSDQLAGYRVGIIGGSIAGCSAAILLSRLGANVTLLERTSSSLVNRGAGIVLPKPFLQQCIALDLFTADIPHLSVTTRFFSVTDATFSPEGRSIWLQAFAAAAFNWRHIYHNLYQRLTQVEYYAGEEVCAIDNKQNIYQLETTTGNKYNFDLVIAADGIDSLIRKKVFPELTLEYAGYCAWRGTIAISQLKNPALFTEGAAYFVFPKGHLLLYCIPSDMPNKPLLNWVLYECANQAPLTSLLQDNNGKQHQRSLPPGSLATSHLHYLRNFAKQVLPDAIADIICHTEQPFLQAIFDLQVPQYVSGHICFIGDAAAVLRPHSASGVLKALNDSMSLAQALNDHNLPIALENWNQTQLALAQQQTALAKTLGAGLVTHAPSWEKMDFATIEEWWQLLMSGKSWYATNY